MKQSILLQKIENENIDTLSLIGMAKNVGKTETLNHLIRYGQSKILGVTSAGLDGEGKDLITLGKKPKIWLPEKALFATAETCLLKADLKYEILDDSGFSNALGRIFLVRVKEAGFVELAGPPMKSGLKSVGKMLQGLGAELVIIDGALDRMGAAGSLITKGAILCTGSVVGKSIDQIGLKTEVRFEQLTLKPASEEIISRWNSLIQSKITFLNQDLEETPLLLDTLVGNENKVLSWIKRQPQLGYLVINGAVTEKLLEMVVFNAHLFQDINLVIRSGNALFVDEQSWLRYKKAHGRISVLEPINVLAISVNPYTAFGKSYAPKELLVNIGSRITPIKPVPVVDVLSGYSL
ncbi:MAG: hypothetical protein AAGU27_25090 [Dehalobacterium sp.]